MDPRPLRAALITVVVLTPLLGAAQSPENAEDDDETPPRTVFTFGGYAKVDALSTTYHDGSPEADAAIRFFHLPAQIPVAGRSDLRRQADAHANESRFHFDLNRTLENDWDLRVYIELDFLLSGQGDERISNSFNPRMRHFYFSAGPFLFGQDWTTFQIVELPDDLDFIGAADG